MADDQPARIEIMRLKALVAVMAETVASLVGTSSVLVVENPADLSTRDASQKAIVFMKANGNGDFGIYFPSVTSDPANGSSIVIDAVGTKFEQFLR